jgi:hypothetical protein
VRAFSNDVFRQFPNRISKPLPPVVCSDCFKIAHPPTVKCSACGKEPHAPRAYVIPWWNSDERRYLTAYRCEGCWKKALDETRQHFNSHAGEEGDWAAFVRFWKLHGTLTVPRDADLEERRKIGHVLLDAVGSRELLLGA